MGDALFERSGDDFLPTEITRGPWSPDALHGGPVSALLAGLAEALPRPGPMMPARITIELLRPVPLAAVSRGDEKRAVWGQHEPRSVVDIGVGLVLHGEDDFHVFQSCGDAVAHEFGARDGGARPALTGLGEAEENNT